MSKVSAPPSDNEPADNLKRGPSRRLILLRGAGVAVLPMALTGCIVETAPARRTGTGLTDRDPNDGPGNGRGTQQRRGTGLTDQDPNDGPGNGRGTQQRRGTGLTDRDPNDGPGNGRGTQQRRNTGLTDRDPSDGPGNGRSGR